MLLSLRPTADPPSGCIPRKDSSSGDVACWDVGCGLLVCRYSLMHMYVVHMIQVCGLDGSTYTVAPQPCPRYAHSKVRLARASVVYGTTRCARLVPEVAPPCHLCSGYGRSSPFIPTLHCKPDETCQLARSMLLSATPSLPLAGWTRTR